MKSKKKLEMLSNDSVKLEEISHVWQKRFQKLKIELVIWKSRFEKSETNFSKRFLVSKSRITLSYWCIHKPKKPNRWNSPVSRLYFRRYSKERFKTDFFRFISDCFTEKMNQTKQLYWKYASNWWFRTISKKIFVGNFKYTKQVHWTKECIL